MVASPTMKIRRIVESACSITHLHCCSRVSPGERERWMRVPRRCTDKTLNGSALWYSRSRDDGGSHGNAGCPVHVAMAAQGACAATYSWSRPFKANRMLWHFCGRDGTGTPTTYLHFTAPEIVLLMQFTTLFSRHILWLNKIAFTFCNLIISPCQIKPIKGNILGRSETNLKNSVWT